MKFPGVIFAIFFFVIRIPAYSDLPVVKNNSVSFLKNKGQWQHEILFSGNSGDAHIRFLRDGLSFAQYTGYKSFAGLPVYQVWNMRLADVNPGSVVSGKSGKASVNSYISGNDPAGWVVHPDQYNELLYENIYNRIDLLWYGKDQHLKYDFVVHPQGSVHDIQSYYEGISGLRIVEDGSLEVSTAAFKQIQERPVAWQIIHGVKKLIAVSYVLINDTTFGFQVEEPFDPGYDLVIDPLFQMVWASYTQATGASNNINYCFGNTMDNEGNVYLTGMVDSTFPITPGAYSGPGTVVPEIFVAKFSSDGTTMLYSTYLPGNSSEHGVAIAVDDQGSAYVTGVVDLNITGVQTFPSTSNAYQTVHDQGSDAFMTVLTPDGTGLVYSTFLGGDGSEGGNGIVLGGPGIAYITGTTSGGTFPVIAAPTFPSGTSEVFVCKFDINQTGNNSLVYSVRIGGGQFNYCSGRALAVNTAGNVFVTGTMGLGFGTMQFPATPGVYSSTYNPGQDNIMSFALKLSNSVPVTLEYATYLVPGIASAIDVDEPSGDVFIAGSTNTFAFPVTPGVIQPVHGGNNGSDAFVVRLNATGSALVYATFLGGDFGDTGTGIAVNSVGEAYVTGIAQDQFPTSAGAYQTANAGSYDFFAVHLNATGTAYGCGGSTYIGGSDADYSGSFYDYPSPRISLRDHGGVNDTICISSTSHSQDFPTTPGVYGPVKVNSIADQPVFFKMTCVVSGVPPDALFASSVNATCSGAIVDFTDNSQNNPTSWQWYFPGAIPVFSNSQNPSGVVFPVTGNYFVSLVACNSFGCDSVSTALNIVIPGAVAVSLGNDTSICNGNNVVLNVPAGFSSYTWTLDGTILSGTGNSLIANQPGVYVVQVTDTAGCSGSDTLNLFVNSPQVMLGNDLTLCNEDSVLIQATPGYASYQWFYNGTALTTTADFLYADQSGQYIVLVSDSTGCQDSDTLQVTFGTVSVTLPPDTSFCSGDTYTINVSTGFATYEWLKNNVIISNFSSIIISESGTYILNVTDAGGCVGTDSINILVHELPVLLVTSDTTICFGTSLQLHATGAQSYTWSPSLYLSSTVIPDPVTTPAGPVTYTVAGSSAQGCTASETITITLIDAPVAAFTYTVDFDCKGILLATMNTSINAISYHWNFGDGSTSQEVSPVHYYGELENQTVQMIAYNIGCSDTAVQSNISFAIPDFIIPNVFTPGSDGKNDCFRIPGMEKISECLKIKIFSRWGKEVYQSKGDTCWDGNSNSDEPLPAGVYYYVITLINEQFNGTVHLLR